MQVLAALGDAPTAAIAVVAILLGVLLVARGPREKRAAGAAANESKPTPTLLKVPITPAPDGDPGFVGPAGEVVGHGPIRLGAPGPLTGGEPAATPPAPPEPAAAPATVPTPPAPEPPPVEAPTSPAAESAPDEPAKAKDPAWRVAARAANSAVHFRRVRGTIKVGGKSAGKRKDP